MTDTTTANEPTGGGDVPKPAELAAAMTAAVRNVTRPAGDSLVVAVREAVRDELRNGRAGTDTGRPERQSPGG